MTKRIFASFTALILIAAMLIVPVHADRNYSFTLTGDQAKDIITVAEAQLGLTGTEMNYSSNWCSYFVGWCGRTAGADFPPSGSSNTPRAITNWFVNNAKGTFYYFRDANYTSLIEKNPKLKHLDLCVKSSRDSFEPKPGDLVIYLWKSADSGINWSHIGIVESFSGTKVYTIEGNVGGHGYAKNTVDHRTRKFSDNSEVVGIVRPNYINTTPVLTMPVLTMKFNANGGYVVSDDYVTDAYDCVLRRSGTEVTSKWEYDYGYESGLFNASTFGLVRDGYSFVGWGRNRDGSGYVFDQDLFYLSQTIYPDLSKGSAEITLYAVWAKDDFLTAIPDGVYALAPGHAADMRLDIYDASCEDGANVQIYQDNGTDAQRFRLALQPDGSYVITNVHSGKALEVADGSWVSNANVQQSGFANLASQRWYLSNAGDGYFYIRPCVDTGLCLDVGGARTENGSNVKTYMIHDSSAQKWQLIRYAGTELTADLSDDRGAVTATVTKGFDTGSRVLLIAAWYDGEGRILDRTTKEIYMTDSVGGSARAELCQPSGAEKAVTCRVFLMDADDLFPLCTPADAQ